MVYYHLPCSGTGHDCFARAAYVYESPLVLLPLHSCPTIALVILCLTPLYKRVSRGNGFGNQCLAALAGEGSDRDTTLSSFMEPWDADRLLLLCSGDIARHIGLGNLSEFRSQANLV